MNTALHRPASAALRTALSLAALAALATLAALAASSEAAFGSAAIARSIALLAVPALALAGNMHGGSDGMDFVRTLFQSVAAQMNENAVLVLDIGNEKSNFERAFPRLEPLWLETSAGDEQVMLLTREQLQTAPHS